MLHCNNFQEQFEEHDKGVNPVFKLPNYSPMPHLKTYRTQTISCQPDTTNTSRGAVSMTEKVRAVLTHTLFSLLKWFSVMADSYQLQEKKCNLGHLTIQMARRVFVKMSSEQWWELLNSLVGLSEIDRYLCCRKSKQTGHIVKTDQITCSV